MTEDRNEETGADLAVPAGASAPSRIPVGPVQYIELAGLSEAEKNALLAEYRKGQLDLAKKAQELRMDVEALEATLTVLANTTKQVAETGTSVTVTHTQDSTVGRTEVIMGNTKKAARGKLSRSQTGDRDWTGWWIIGAVVVVAIVLLIALGH